MGIRASLSVLMFLAGCRSSTPDVPAMSPISGPLELIEISEPIECAAPEAGFARFEEQAAERGLVVDLNGDLGLPPNFVPQTSIIAVDLDGDGDIDLMFGNLAADPPAFENDGTGHFTRVHINPSEEDGSANAIGVADLDGDGLPELVQVGIGTAFLQRNLGGMQFGKPEIIYEQSAPPFADMASVSFGDPDGDGDIDLLITVLETFTTRNGDTLHELGGPELLFRNDDGSFTLIAELVPNKAPAISLCATFTDRDGDNDVDLMVMSKLTDASVVSPPSAFYRNDGADADGALSLENDAAEIGFDIMMSAMGIATADFNEDGDLDYCVSDLGPPKCLISDGHGGYYRGEQAMGLIPDVPNLDSWSGWSLEVADFDNDGLLDLAMAAGRALGGSSTVASTDVIFQGVGREKFVDRSAAVGFDDPEDHFGLVAADLDGDGALEIVICPGVGQPKLWMNRCTAGAWIQVKLDGPGLNRQAFGARVTVAAGDRRWTREVQGPRAMGQSPGWLHFGVGDQAQVQLQVRWPDGQTQTFENVPTRRRVTLRHPARLTASR